eukprot:scpid94616/ scgid28404/ 
MTLPDPLPARRHVDVDGVHHSYTRALCVPRDSVVRVWQRDRSKNTRSDGPASAATQLGRSQLDQPNIQHWFKVSTTFLADLHNLRQRTSSIVDLQVEETMPPSWCHPPTHRTVAAFLYS